MRTADPNENIPVDCRRAARAYDLFDKGEGELDKERSFNMAIEACLRQRGFELKPTRSDARWFLANRRTISNWRKHSGKVLRRRCVIEAVYQLTGIDISDALVLRGRPIDFTPLVRLSNVVARRISNRPNEDGYETYALRVERLNIEIGRIELRSSWLKDGPPGQERIIGRLVFGVGKAHLVMDGSISSVEDPIQVLAPGQSSDRGSIAGGELQIAHDSDTMWTVVSRSATSLIATMSNVDLADVKLKSGASLDFRILADPQSIETEFSNTVMPSPSEAAHARSKLLAHLFGRRAVQARYVTNYVLSRQDIEVPE